MSPFYSDLPSSSAYDSVRRKLDVGGCVLVDGGVASELAKIRADGERSRREPWGVWALYSAETDVLDVHRRYVAAGCDVLSTNSWSILDEAENWERHKPSAAWEAAADSALRLARRATADHSRAEDCAVAFCINGDLASPRALGALELLTWRWRGEAPDLVIFETLEKLPSARIFEAVSLVADLGLPVWVSMRRADGGMASVDGKLLADKDPADLKRAVAELERRGVSAVLVNCIPRQLVAPAVSSLAQVSSVPVGCLPNLGHHEQGRWEPGEGILPERFADEALEWMESGARIIGGCCGVGPAHIRALQGVVETAVAWSARGV